VIEACLQNPTLLIEKNTGEGKPNHAPAAKTAFLFAGVAGADLEYAKPACCKICGG
jgi:hypothetical protein